jgi:protease IV
MKFGVQNMKMQDDKNIENKKRIWTMVKILLILLIFSAIIALFFKGSNENLTGYNTAIISVKGEITSEGSSGLFSSATAGSPDIIDAIENAKNDANVKAVIFEIDSPGGSAVATDEIAQAIKSLNDENITSVAWIRETGASGAYWIASSTNHIVANRMSIVGSIGVTGSYLEWYGLMNKYNVTYKRLVAGEYKDSGTPYRPLSSAEEALIQEKLDKIYSYFIGAVAENRNMTFDNVKKLANGDIYLGVEAKDNGLIDELGGYDEAVKYLENKMNITVTTKEFTKQKTFIESITGVMSKNSYYIGQGIASGLVKDEGLKITT